MFYFENDYCEGAHPAILQKLMETNFEKVPGYGTDPYCASAREKIRAACACPEADVTFISCLLYTSDAADEEDSVDIGGRRFIKKKKRRENRREQYNQYHKLT